MVQGRVTRATAPAAPEAGFTLIELMIGVAVLMIVSSTVMSGVLNMTRVTETLSNRSEMHSGVRNATEFMQQEIGQAGRIGFPGVKTLGTAVGTPGAATVTISPDATGLFVNEKIVIDTGALEETVTITAIAGNQVTATFGGTHLAGAPVSVQGGFGHGVIAGAANGSDGQNLKIFGDLRGNGLMQYVEYFCDQDTTHNLYRRVMEFTDATKPAYDVSHVLLNNVYPNPGGTPCFTYTTRVISGNTYVINVAVTLTVQTQDPDPITGAFQRETKALLNVAPRNVFHVWQLASQDVVNRLQPVPASVAGLVVATPVEVP